MEVELKNLFDTARCQIVEDFNNKGKIFFEESNHFCYQVQSENYAFSIRLFLDEKEHPDIPTLRVFKIFKPCYIDVNGIWTAWEDGPQPMDIFQDYFSEEHWQSAIKLIARHAMEHI